MTRILSAALSRLHAARLAAVLALAPMALAAQPAPTGSPAGAPEAAETAPAAPGEIVGTVLSAPLVVPVTIGRETGLLQLAGKGVTLPFRAVVIAATGRDPKTDLR